MYGDDFWCMNKVACTHSAEPYLDSKHILSSRMDAVESEYALKKSNCICTAFCIPGIYSELFSVRLMYLD